MRHSKGARSYFAALTLCLATAASAHDARPVSVNITQHSAVLYVARVRIPPTLPIEDRVSVGWPTGCTVVGDNVQELESEGREVLAVKCSRGLEGRDIKIAYRVYNPALSTLFQLNELDGRNFTQVLSPDVSIWRVPQAAGPWAVARSYLTLGVRHIWTGVDHLLFVTGLLVLGRTARRVLLAVTGFTLAHSITLALSALNVVVLPEPPVEAAIALSILFLAYEIARPHPQGLAARYPILVASSFGLLHGFGFAAALREIGLPAKDLAVGLFCFNCGVELGQIAFFAAILALVCGARAAISAAGPVRLFAILAKHNGAICGYGLGLPAAVWFFQRLAAF